MVTITISKKLVLPAPPPKPPPKPPVDSKRKKETPAQAKAREKYEAAAEKYKEAKQRYDDARDKARDTANRIEAKKRRHEQARQRSEEAGKHKERLRKLKEAADKALEKADREQQKTPFKGDYRQIRHLHAPKHRAVPPPHRMPAKGGEPVDLFSGAFTAAEMDLVIPGQGLPLTVTRHYNNQAYFHGSFGAKWDVWFDARLRKVAGGAIYVWFGNGRGDFFVPDGQGGFDAPFDHPLKLTSTGTGFILEDADGTRQHFDAAGGLEGLADRFGNAIELLRSTGGRVTGLKDTLGRKLNFTRDKGCIVKITDWTGRTWNYTYDSRNNLVGLTLPDGQKKAFRYDHGADPRLWHNLTQMRDHHDALSLENRYGNQKGTFNRIVKQRYEGVSFTFSYDFPAPRTSAAPASRHTVSHQCIYTDGRGVRHEYDFNPWGRLLETRVHPLPGESGSAQTTLKQRYDQQGHLASLTFPRGNRLEYTCDSANADPRLRLRPLEIREIPAGSGTARVTKFTYGSAPLPTTVTLPDGTVHRTRYNAHNQPVKLETPAFERHDGSTAASATTLEYDRHGRLIRETDGNGRKTEILYYSSGPQRGQVKALLREGQRIAAFTYDPLGRVITERDVAGNTIAYTYDAADRLVGIRPPGAPDVDVQMAYNTLGQLIRSQVRNRDEHGNLRTPEWIIAKYAYDPMGRLAEEQQLLEPGVWAKTRYTWDANDNLTRAVDPEGLALGFAYDAHNRLRMQTTAPGTPFATTERFEYDTNGNLVKARDALGQAVTTAYDGFDRPVKRTDPDGAAVTSAYDALDRVIATKGYDGGGTLRTHTTAVYSAIDLLTETRTRLFAPDATPGSWLTDKYAYDALGRLRRITNPLGTATTFTYDAFDRLTTTKAPDGTTLWNQWDASGRQVGCAVERPGTGPGGKPQFFVQTREYDKQGRLTATKDGLGNRATFVYDGLDRLVKTTTPGGVTSKIFYDLAGRETRVTSPRIDADGKPLPASTNTFEYDRSDRLTAFTDALNRTTRLRHDTLGQLLSLTRPDGTVPFTRRFDIAGRLVEALDARGVRTTFRYDARNRLARLDVSGPRGGVEGFKHQTFGYDAYGNLTRSENDHHSLSAGFDSLGRLLHETVDGKTVQYKYGANGLPDAVVYPSGFTLGMVWDANGQLRDLSARATGRDFPGGSLPGKPLARFVPGRDSISRANGLTTRLRMDAAGRPLIEETTDSNGKRHLRLDTLFNAGGDLAVRHRHGLATTAFRYDAEGQLVREHEGPVSAVDLSGFLPSSDRNQPLPAKTQGELDQLAQAPANPSRSVRYAYDAAGNRTEVTHTLGSRINRTAYTSDRGDRYTRVGNEQFTYDAAGNLIEDADHTYFYDAFNRLVRVRGRTSGKDVLKQSFDPLGRRTQVVVAGKTRHLSYDGASLIAADNGQGKLRQLIVHGPALDAPLVVFENNKERYLHLDGSGSVIALSDAKGIIRARYLDDAFGRPVGAFDGAFQPLTPAPDAPFRFHGRPDAGVDDLSDFRTRLYDPGLGRFLQPDPAGPAGDTNLYRFARNNPANYGDPFGAAPKRRGSSLLGLFFSPILDVLWHPIDRAITGVGNFIGGLAYGAAMLVYEPIAQVRDLVVYDFEFGYTIGWKLFGKGAYVGLDFKPWSHLGQAIFKGNLGPLDTVGMMAKNLVMTPVRWGKAAWRGDMFAFGQETLGMVLIGRAPARAAGNMVVRRMVNSRSVRIGRWGHQIRSWQVQRLHRKAQRILERNGYTWEGGANPTSRYIREGGKGVRGSYDPKSNSINIYEEAFNLLPSRRRLAFDWTGNKPLNTMVHEMWHRYQLHRDPVWYNAWKRTAYDLNPREFTTFRSDRFISDLVRDGHFPGNPLFAPQPGFTHLQGAWNAAFGLTPPGPTLQTGLLLPLLGSRTSSKSNKCR